MKASAQWEICECEFVDVKCRETPQTRFATKNVSLQMENSWITPTLPTSFPQRAELSRKHCSEYELISPCSNILACDPWKHFLSIFHWEAKCPDATDSIHTTSATLLIMHSWLHSVYTFSAPTPEAIPSSQSKSHINLGSQSLLQESDGCFPDKQSPWTLLFSGPNHWTKGSAFLHFLYRGNVQHINVWKNRFWPRRSTPAQP